MLLCSTNDTIHTKIGMYLTRYYGVSHWEGGGEVVGQDESGEFIAIVHVFLWDWHLGW